MCIVGHVSLRTYIAERATQLHHAANGRRRGERLLPLPQTHFFIG